MRSAESFPVFVRITGRKAAPKRPSKGNPLSFKCTTTFTRQQPAENEFAQALINRDWIDFGFALLGRDFVRKHIK